MTGAGAEKEPGMATKKHMLVVAVVGVLAVSGCTAGTTPGASGPSSSSPSVAASPTVTPTPVAPTPTATVAKALGCTTDQVSVIVGKSSGAAGTLVQEMDVHNTSAVTCTLEGHPFISPYGKQPQGGGTV